MPETAELPREQWTMPPLALLRRPQWSTGRKVAMLGLQAYLIVSVIILIIKAASSPAPERRWRPGGPPPQRAGDGPAPAGSELLRRS